MTDVNRVNKMLNIIDELVDYGFKVYYIPNTTYCYYVMDDRIAYTQVDYIGIQTITSVRKPNREYGTGTRVESVNAPFTKEEYNSAFNYHYASIDHNLWYKDEKEWIKQAYKGNEMVIYMK